MLFIIIERISLLLLLHFSGIIKLKHEIHVLNLITLTHWRKMKLRLIRFFILGVLALNMFYLQAQEVKLEKDEYKAEIGIIGGGSYYLGDANSQLFNNMQLIYGGMFRYVIDARIALRAEFSSADIAGIYNDQNSLKSFKKTIYSADFCGEFNFFDLEKNPYKQFSKPFSPYIFTGFGGMTGLYATQKLPEVSWVFGLGMKVKLVKRLNLNIQWSNKLLLNSDYMEGKIALNNPAKLNGSNIFNNDLLSTVTVGISLDIWKKPCNCLNNNN